MNGGPAMVLDRKRADAMVSEKERGGHTHEAASDYQNRDFEVVHVGK
jgi:hypothetical protein